jgi:phage terminase large subunit-like protein
VRSPREKIIAELERRGIDWQEALSQKGPPPPSLADFVESTVNFKLHDWQRNNLCPILERCVHEKGLRLAVHGPPRYGKSIIVSQRLPAWLMGLDPTHRIGVACYNETRAGEFGDVVKQIMCSPQYQDTFPNVFVKHDAPSGRFSTRQRMALLDAQASYTAMGLLSGFVGRGVDTLIVDDPYKSADEARSEVINEKVWRWWSETAKVRIDTDANVIVMFHRYHEDDFAGRLLADGFEYVRFPAIADENEDGSDPTGRQVGELLSPMRSAEFLQTIQDADVMTWLGMFQGRPRPPEGAFFLRDWFKTGIIPVLDLKVRYWDLATSVKQTGDWTVGALGGIDPLQRFCLEDVIRFKAEWPDVAAKIAEVTEREAWEASQRGIRYVVGVDARLSQQGFFQQLMRMRIFNPEGEGMTVPLWPDKFTGDKKQSASGLAADMKYGRFVMKSDPSWNEPFVNECLAFTGNDTDTDDQVDAASGLHRLVWSLTGGIRKDQKEAEAGSPAWFEKHVFGKNKHRGVFA